MSPLLADLHPALIALLVIVGVVVFGATAYLSHKAEVKRREEMAALAERLGCRFDPSRDRTHDEMYSRIDVFRQGHSRAAYNTIQGKHEIGGRPFPLKMGDFTYKVTSSNGKSTSTSTYNLSYLILHLPVQAPDLLIRQENMLDKLAGALGFDDIDFESEAFSRRFHVKCRDRKFAYAVVHPPVMEFLMSGGGSPPSISISGGCCCITDGTRRWSPGEFESRLEWLGRFFGLWPDYLMAELEARR